MTINKLTAVDANSLPWEERFNERIGRALFRKNLFIDPETGMEIRLVRYPAGIINPAHTHPCGHGMYVLEERWSRTPALSVPARSSGFQKAK